MKLKILLTFILGLFFFNFIAATCTVTLDKEFYSQTETAVADMFCTSASEKSTAYTLNWTYENGTSVELDSSITPATTGEHFYESYVIPSNWPAGVFVNATLQGINLEGTDSANVSGASANSLLISNASVGGRWLGLVSSVHATIKDENGKKISGGSCKASAWSNDETQMLASATTALFDGVFKIEAILNYAAFDEAKDYAVLIHCFCGSTGSSSECIDEDGNAITNSIGTTKIPFTTNIWLTINEDPFPITYQNGTDFSSPIAYSGFGEHVYFKANVTNNYGTVLRIDVNSYLINNDTGEVYQEPNLMVKSFSVKNGSQVIISNHEIITEAPTGVYYITNFFDIYFNNLLVSQGIVNTATFNVTGTDDSFLFSNVSTNKPNYYTGEEMHVCANITNDYDQKVEFEILYNYRCGSTVNGNFDTDRTILGKHVELRAVDSKTSQYQCASLSIPFHDHLLYRTSLCYASVTIKSPYIATFDNKKTSTSSLFNITDYGMTPQYETDPGYPFIRLFPDWKRFDELIDNVSKNYVRTQINISKLNEDYLDPSDIIEDNSWNVYIALTEKMPVSTDIYNYSIEYANGTAIDNPVENACLQWRTSPMQSLCSIGIKNINFSDPNDDYFIVKVWFEDFNERQTEALEGIETKTGTFHMSVDCPNTGTIGEDISCIISAQIEESQEVEKEVDFTCYIVGDGNTHSSINFNQMITKTPVSISRDFLVPSSLKDGSQYVLQCHGDYYNLGQRRDSFYDTFTVSTISGGGSPAPITGEIIGEGEEIETDKDEEEKDENYLIFIVIILCLVALIIITNLLKRKKGICYFKEDSLKQIFIPTFAIILFFGVITSLFYAYRFVKNKLIPETPAITSSFNLLVQDNFIRVILFLTFIVLMIILLFKTLNIRGEIKFGGENHYSGDGKLTRMQNKLNQMILKDEMKKKIKEGKKRYRIVKVKRK